MIPLLGAVLIASFLGSLHCVGMCGPLALVATTQENRKTPLFGPLAAYHLSRVLGYTSFGVVAGAFGAAVQSTGDLLGLQQAAARIAGGTMALLGILMVLRLAAGNSPHFILPSKLQTLFGKLHQIARRQSPLMKATTVGALTVFLPCGWLYAFLITAAATASPWQGGAVMVMFWIGTVPSLTVMLFSVHMLTQRLRRVLPWISAILLVGVGFYTMSHRAHASYDGLTQATKAAPQQQLELLEKNTSMKPACCQTKDDKK
ncbi:MAG: sulfite exporter TauE/SafE family protein [Planctomycetaceae bacterium]|nr:sulfite exporter TauE/SafE family protein [Planctomycetaceae bacterium]